MGDATTLYATEDEYKAYLGVSADELSDQQSAELLDACRAWDLLCGVEPGWFVAGASASAKLFDITNSYELYVDGIAASAGVVVKIDGDGDRVFETTLDAARDYYLEPAGGPPFTSIVIDSTNGRYSFPKGRRRVEVTARHGFAVAAPGPIRRVCLLIAKRYSVRPNTPEGIKEGAEHMMRLAAEDPDVLAVLATGAYKKMGVFA